MKIFKLVQVAQSSLLKNKTRSLLTMLGIVIGVSAVVVMVAVGKGAQKNIEERISSLGTNILMIRPGSSSYGGVRGGAGSRRSLTYDDEVAIRENAKLVSGVSGVVQRGEQVVGGGQNWYTTIYGIAPEYLEIRDWEVESGNMFTEREMRVRAKVAVLGATTATELFEGQAIIGQTIRVKNVPFKVIGVLQAKGESSFGRDQDDVILVPLSTALYRLSRDPRYVDMLYASAVSTDSMDAAAEEVTDILRQTHRLVPGEEDDFSIRTQTELTEAFSSTTKALTSLLGAIAGVSLFVGGVGIMNIMLVSVTERTREIGIRVAVGARNFDILIQFLIEAIVLSLVGGLIGVGLSWGFCRFLTQSVGMTTIIESWVVVGALVVSAIIGIFFGLYPAQKAAQLDPIEALRHE